MALINVKFLLDKAEELKNHDLSIPQIELKTISDKLSQKAGYNIKASVGATGNLVRGAGLLTLKIEW